VWGAQTRSVCRQDAGSLDYSCRVFRREVTKVVHLANGGRRSKATLGPDTVRSCPAVRSASPTMDDQPPVDPPAAPVDSRSTPRQLAVAVPTDSDSGPARQDEVQSRAFLCRLQEGFSQREGGSDEDAVLHVFPRRERPATSSVGRGSSGCRIASSPGHRTRRSRRIRWRRRNRSDKQQQPEQARPRSPSRRRRPRAGNSTATRLRWASPRTSPETQTPRSLARCVFDAVRALLGKRQRPWSGDRKRFRRRSG